MHKALFAATVTLALLSACKPAPEQANAANSGANAAVENAAVPVSAPVGKEEAAKIMHERHEGMEKIGKSMKALGREMMAGTSDLATVRSSAATIADLAPKASSWFPAGTGPDVGKTHAKAEIWQKPEEFAAKAKDFQNAAAAFNEAAKAGDMTQIKARFGDLGKSCKACHDSYRAKHAD
ncbi:MAG: cytochrome c [Sphingomicrobium sp.]